MSDLISQLLAKLRDRQNDEWVTNPYVNELCCENLRVYLKGLIAWPCYSKVLLIGEAPGHAGCARTGIPFTSEFVIQKSNHPFLSKYRPAMRTLGDKKEPTATIVWEYLSKKPSFPALWNIFPFHPHESGNARKNRRPKKAEIESAYEILNLVETILNPERIFAIGLTAYDELSQQQHALIAGYVRHPANAGKPDFIAGMDKFRI